MSEEINSHKVNKKIPQILSLSESRVGEWVDSSWKWLTKLRTAVLLRFQEKNRLSTKNLRFEQRDAIGKVLKVIFQHLDLNTMCVGVYHRESETFVHLSLNFIAKKSGLHIRRAQRAMSWLYKSGYILGYRQSFYDVNTEEYYHKPSIRRVNSNLLFDLGITEYALQRARSRSKKKFHDVLIKSLSTKNKIQPKPTNETFNVTGLLTKLTQAFSMPSKSKSQELDPTHIEKLHKLMHLMPNLSYEEAKRMLPHS